MEPLIAAALIAFGVYSLARRQTAETAPAGGGGFWQDLGSVIELNLGPIVGSGPSEDQDVLARTLYGEARGQGRAAMENVASVILNRYRKRQAGEGYASWGPVGASIAQICKAPWQFSCWNANDPNLPVLRAVTTADPAFRVAMDVAADAINGLLFDRTGGADHYFATSMASLPSWAKGATTTLQDLGHKFIKLVT
jgi:spore germination cell wall hydrolase CwlJ-like protein